MRVSNRSGHIAEVLAGILVALGLFSLVSIFRFSLQNVAVFVVAVIVFVVAFLKTDVALILLIFSMLFSPELSVGAIPGRTVVLRIDDIFLLVVFFGWMARAAVHKELGVVRTTPLNLPIVVYIFLAAIVTLFAAARGQEKISHGFFYLMKYVEYFILFFMVTNNLKDRNQIRLFVYLMIAVCLLVSLYGWVQHFSGTARVTAPFEGKEGEANTLGGYLIMLLMVTLGIALNARQMWEKIFLGIVLFFGIPALSFTLSRGSWLGFLPAFSALVFLTQRNKILLLVLIIFVSLLSSFVIPNFVRERVSSTFVTGKEYTLLGRQVALEDSASARIENWRKGLKYSARQPLFGYGVGNSAAIIDNQYARVLIEMGYVGFFVFIWLMVMIYRSAMQAYQKLLDDRFAHGLVAGFIAGFVGLLVHGISADTFIIIRIMEPFWFLTAIVVMLPEILPVPGEKAAFT